MEFVHIELKRDSWMKPELKVENPQDAVRSISRLVENMGKEVIAAINIATDGRVINSSIISMGTVNQSIISISEIIRVAILSGGASVILLHNHPSGCCLPSCDDRETTKKVAVACNLVGLELLDHIVVGTDGTYYSFREAQEESLIVEKNEYQKLWAEEKGEADEK